MITFEDALSMTGVTVSMSDEFKRLTIAKRKVLLKEISMIVDEMYKITRELNDTVEEARDVLENALGIVVEEVTAEMNPYVAEVIADNVRERMYLEYPELNPKEDQ